MLVISVQFLDISVLSVVKSTTTIDTNWYCYSQSQQRGQALSGYGNYLLAIKEGPSKSDLRYIGKIIYSDTTTKGTVPQ